MTALRPLGIRGSALVQVPPAHPRHLRVRNVLQRNRGPGDRSPTLLRSLGIRHTLHVGRPPRIGSITHVSATARPLKHHRNVLTRTESSPPAIEHQGPPIVAVYAVFGTARIDSRYATTSSSETRPIRVMPAQLQACSGR